MSATSANGLLAVCGSFMALSSIAVGLRIYGRKSQGLSLGSDDWTALFGVITYIGASALAIELVVLKADGYDNGTLTPAQAKARAKPTVQISLAYDFLIMNTLACAKLSALFLYQRLFNVAGRGLFNVVIMITVVVIAMWYITFDALSLLQCRSHFTAFWDGNFKKYCDLNPVWARGLAISDFLLDLWVVLLPVPMICRLQTNIVKKLSIIGIFLLAFVGVGASIARIVVFFTVKGPGAETLYIGVLEAGMTITVVNLPSIWYIFISTIPTHLRRSLDSLSRLRSRSSGSSRVPSENSSKIDNAGAKAPIYFTENEKSWASRDPSPTHQFRTDLEGGGCETSVMRAPDRDESTETLTNGIPPNVIRVRNEVEVQSYQS